MLTKTAEVIKYIKASGNRASLNVYFEDRNEPRHDGDTIFLPNITSETTEEELIHMMASIDHEVNHELYSDFEVLKKKRVNPASLLFFIWNLVEDSRVNRIEAAEYAGFKQNWDISSSLILENIVSNLTKAKKLEPMETFAGTALYWDTQSSHYMFPMSAAVTSSYKYSKDILDILEKYTDRLIKSASIINKTKGTLYTFRLAKDIYKHFADKEDKPYLDSSGEGTATEGCSDKEASKAAKKDKESGEKDSKADVGKSTSDSDTVDEYDDDEEESEDEEYKVITIKAPNIEEDFSKLAITAPKDSRVMGKVGVNIEYAHSAYSSYAITDPAHTVVVDYPRNIGNPRYLTTSRASIEFISEYNRNIVPFLMSQENFAQQVRRLIQVRSRCQMQYGVKKGKLDQARLSRICFKDAQGFNERVFKNKIDNKTLDVALSVLVDMSGSMSGMKAYNACAATLLLAEVCNTLHIPVEIIGFTDEASYGYPLMFIYKGYNQAYVNQDAILQSFAKSSGFMLGNPDGENILWAYERLKVRKEKRKILIVMSDGSPAASNCRRGLENFTLKVIREIEANSNTEIYGLGLLSYAVTHYYKHNSVVMKAQEIPQKLLHLIETKVLGV